MAQRVTGFAKKPAATEAIVAGVIVRSMDEEAAEPRAIALELAPLIAPYRKQGRLSLRVERLPHRARLSRGHNNGDRSWSLMSDELDGLVYLPPRGAADACTLGIRIVSLDGGGGATLALIDYPVSPDGAAAPPVVEKSTAPKRLADADTSELHRLRDEVATAKAALAEHDAELKLAVERAAAHHAAELAAARVRWEGETQDRLAASSALASQMLERNRAAWQAEHVARASRPEPRADERVVSSRKDIETALARAEKEWKAGEAARLAAAEVKWEARAAKTLADANAQLERARTRASAESARDRSDDAERKRLRDEVARLKKSLAAREEEIVRAREAGQSESEAALAEAESAWREQEAQHLAAARAQWQERSERALAEATAQFERAQIRVQTESGLRHRTAEAELERLQDELASANDAIADRENDIADIQARLDEQIRQADALGAHEGEIRRLKSDIESLRAIVADRDRTLVQSRADLEQARLDWRRESQAALAGAQEQWKRAEAERLLAAETQVQEQSQVALSRIAQRLKQVEADLQQARAYGEALQKRGDSDDIKQLRRDFGHLQALLAERETEVAQLRLDSEHARERWTAEARMSLQKAEQDWKTEAQEADRQERRAGSTRRTIRDVALVAALSAVAVIFYLRSDSTSVESLLPGTLTNWMDPSVGQAVAPVPAAAPVKQAAEPMVTVVRAANMRSAPSKTASVIATLPRNTDVPSLARHGNWVRVRIETAHKPQEGWVYSTYLQDKAAPRS